MDKLTAAERSALMSKIKSRDTLPELYVRRVLTSYGYRYRIYRKDLPGNPDIVFVSKRKVIFVNGCFWHGHDCGTVSLPKSNKRFWIKKFEANKKRDRINKCRLTRLGWSHYTIWCCRLKKNPKREMEKVRRFLENDNQVKYAINSNADKKIIPSGRGNS